MEKELAKAEQNDNLNVINKLTLTMQQIEFFRQVRNYTKYCQN